MAFRYTIPEISAITLLSSVEEKDGKFDIFYDAAEPSREFLVKWTQQDDCPMFHQAMRLLKGYDRLGYTDGDALSEVFVYVDFPAYLTADRCARWQSFSGRRNGCSVPKESGSA